MRIALWNASGLDNLGDRLLDHVTRRELGMRLPKASFQTFSPWPVPSIPLVQIDANGAWGCEGSFDAIVIGGGALLIGPPFMHPSLQTCYLGPYPDRFRDRCPVVWNAVCADGQFVTLLRKTWRTYVNVASQRLSHRSVRNAGTAKFLARCGVTDPVSIVPDPVTLLRGPAPPRGLVHVRQRIGLALGASGQSKHFITLLESPADSWDCNPDVQVRVPEGFWSASVDSPTAVVARVVKATAHMRRRMDLDVCAFGSVYGDEQVADALAEALGARRISFQDPLGSDALDWIGSLDCVIASRLHACVMALVVGTPFVALDPYFSCVAETSKIREFMDDANLLSAYATLQSFVDGACDLDQLLQQALAERERLQIAHSVLTEAARAHFDRLVEVIQGGSARAA